VDEITLDHQLCFALYSASMAIGRAYKPVLDALEITYPQYLVLSTLWERGAQSVGSIADRLALESSTITPLVKRLEQADFVVRKRNPEDERQVVVSLTVKGTAMREKARCLGETLFAAARMSPKRLIDLNREVRAFRDAVTDSMETAGAASTRHSPRPLVWAKRFASPGRNAPREGEGVPSFRGARSASPESIKPRIPSEMDSGPAPNGRILRCAIAHRGMTSGESGITGPPHPR